MTQINVPLLLSCSNTFTSRAFSIVHRPQSALQLGDMKAHLQPYRGHNVDRRYLGAPLACSCEVFCWLFNLKNVDLIMTVKKVPKILWLRKFCNFCILHVHMHIMKITQHSCQTNSCFSDNFTIPYLSVEKVSHFYLKLKKSKFLKWCVFSESEYI